MKRAILASRLIALLVLCGFVAFPLIGCAAPISAPASSEDVSRTLAAFVQGRPGVAILAAVVDRANAVTYTSGDLGSNAPKLDEQTEFQIGSVTKTFTATLLAVMVGSGEVKLDDPIQRYLPVGVTAPSFHGRPITLRNLAEQNSGLPALPTNFEMAPDPYANYTPEKLYAFLSHYRLTRAPGERYEYSNLGVGLLGDLLAARERTTYAALLQRRVLQPLGLESTAVVPSADMLAHLAPGHDAPYDTSEIWHFRELAACGSIYSNLHDMLRYVQANLAAPNGALGAAMALAQEPRAPVTRQMRIGLVWNTIQPLDITWHNGQVGGYHAFVGFDRLSGTGVVVLANDADMTVDAVALHILAPRAYPVPAFTAAASPAPEDEAVSTRVKALYQSYIAGNVDTSQMTPDFAKLFTSDFIAQLRAGTQQLGTPTAWVYAGSAPDNGAMRYDYRVTLASGVQMFSVWIAPDGKIAGSRLAP